MIVTSTVLATFAVLNVLRVVFGRESREEII